MDGAWRPTSGCRSRRCQTAGRRTAAYRPFPVPKIFGDRLTAVNAAKLPADLRDYLTTMPSYPAVTVIRNRIKKLGEHRRVARRPGLLAATRTCIAQVRVTRMPSDSMQTRRAINMDTTTKCPGQYDAST